MTLCKDLSLQRYSIKLYRTDKSKDNSKDTIPNKRIITFSSINSIREGLFNIVWSSEIIGGQKYLNDGFKIGFKLFTLDLGDILEIDTNGNKKHYIMKYEGLKEFKLDEKLIQQTEIQYL